MIRPLSGLIIISDRTRLSRPLLQAAPGILDARPAAFMLREKDLGGAALVDLARSLSRNCEPRGVVLIVNDRIDVALAIPGAGAHVGVAGLPVDRARALLGPDRLLGYSAHRTDEANAAFLAGADYVTLSPIFDSVSKPGREPRGLDFLRDAATRLPGPVFALGGVDETHLEEIRRAGAAGAAVMGAVAGSPDPGAAARRLVRAWDRAAAGSERTE